MPLCWEKQGGRRTDCVREHIIQHGEAFARLFPQLLPPYQGRFAFMRDGEIVVFYATMQEASTAGHQVCRDPSGFSVLARVANAEEG